MFFFEKFYQTSWGKNTVTDFWNSAWKKSFLVFSGEWDFLISICIKRIQIRSHSLNTIDGMKSCVPLVAELWIGSPQKNITKNVGLVGFEVYIPTFSADGRQNYIRQLRLHRKHDFQKLTLSLTYILCPPFYEKKNFLYFTFFSSQLQFQLNWKNKKGAWCVYLYFKIMFPTEVKHEIIMLVS